MRRARFISGAILGGLLAVGLAAGPASAATAVSVTPNVNLKDGDTVSVNATGFTANANLAVIECDTSATSIDNCDVSTALFTNADPTGALTTDYNVFRTINTTADGTLDCAPTNCVLAVANIDNPDPSTEANGQVLNFDASIPPPPPLTVDVTVNKTGSFDKAGNVTLKGTATCSQPVDLYLDGFVQQRAGRAILAAEGYNDLPCDGTISFTVVANPYNGIFRGGKATLALYWDASTGSRDVSGETDAVLALKGPGGSKGGSTSGLGKGKK
jgi:hypothetical protein